MKITVSDYTNRTIVKIYTKSTVEVDIREGENSSVHIENEYVEIHIEKDKS